MTRHRLSRPRNCGARYLKNHAKEMVSVDFFTVPTIRFQVLYVFLVMAAPMRAESVSST